MRHRQLQLFSTAEVAAMRDRTASRNYSPGCAEFRRTHERHRAWGLTRRHAERLRQLRDRPRDSRSARTGQHPPGRPPSTLARESVAATRAPHPAPGCDPLSGPAQGRRRQSGRVENTGTCRSRPAPLDRPAADVHRKPATHPAHHNHKPAAQPTHDDQPEPVARSITAPGDCQSFVRRRTCRPTGTGARQCVGRRPPPTIPYRRCRSSGADCNPLHRIKKGASECRACGRSPPDAKAPIVAMPHPPARSNIHRQRGNARRERRVKCHLPPRWPPSRRPDPRLPAPGAARPRARPTPDPRPRPTHARARATPAPNPRPRPTHDGARPRPRPVRACPGPRPTRARARSAPAPRSRPTTPAPGPRPTHARARPRPRPTRARARSAPNPRPRAGPGCRRAGCSWSSPGWSATSAN
jgi:hypothetical protein